MESSQTIGHDGVVRLRWAVVAGLLATVVFARVTGLTDSAAVPVGIVAVAVASNAALLRSRHPAAIPFAMVFDVVALTTILRLTGGANNPFTALYLVQVALAAVLLGPAWTAALAALAAVGFAALFPSTDPHAMHQAGAGGMQSHLFGMWLALAVVGAEIAWFVARLARELRASEAEVARLRRHAEEQERLVALAGLAAGAAHELGSPLAAIAVSAREIEVLAGDDADVVDEARAQRAQIERCRDILSRLTHRAGAPQAELAEPVAWAATWARVAATLHPLERARTEFVAPPAEAGLVAPPLALAESIGSLVRNALQAGPGGVEVAVVRDGPAWSVRVRDHGQGLDEAVRERLGQPFVSTRPVGEGMGLGLYLVRRFAESRGGALALTAADGGGTLAQLRLPAEAA